MVDIHIFHFIFVLLWFIILHGWQSTVRWFLFSTPMSSIIFFSLVCSFLLFSFYFFFPILCDCSAIAWALFYLAGKTIKDTWGRWYLMIQSLPAFSFCNVFWEFGFWGLYLPLCMILWVCDAIPLWLLWRYPCNCKTIVFLDCIMKSIKL